MEKLEDDPYKKCGDVKVWCETAVTKLEVLERKGKESKYWTPKLAKELAGHKDGLRQQVKLLTKIYKQRKLQTSQSQGAVPRSFERTQDQQHVYDPEQQDLGKVTDFVICSCWWVYL